MKKLLMILAVAAISLSAAAQVQFGAKVGVDATNFWGENVPHGMKLGYQAGLLMEYKFTDKVAVAPEVVFAAQGGEFKLAKSLLGVDLSKLGLSDPKVTYNTNYINVPVMFKYYVVPDFAIDFGPQIGFNVYSKYSIEHVKDAIDFQDATNTIDFGLGQGGTYSLTENAFVQARYTMGLTDAFDGNHAKNGNIQVAFGYKF